MLQQIDTKVVSCERFDYKIAILYTYLSLATSAETGQITIKCLVLHKSIELNSINMYEVWNRPQNYLCE